MNHKPQYKELYKPQYKELYKPQYKELYKPKYKELPLNYDFLVFTSLQPDGVHLIFQTIPIK